jgi:hypothetical protein
MIIKWVDTDDIENAGQFVVRAENDIERAILRRFVRMGEKGYKFRLHSYGGLCENFGWDTFNFGFAKD